MNRVLVTIVFLMTLVVTAFVALPAQDPLELTYDESETLPYEGAPISLSVPRLGCLTVPPGDVRNIPSHGVDLPRRDPRRVLLADRSPTHAGPSLSLLDCSFRC